MFGPVENTGNSYLKLNHSFRKTNAEKNSLPCIGPDIWNRSLQTFKKMKSLNTFKHKMKHYYLNNLSNPNL